MTSIAPKRLAIVGSGAGTTAAAVMSAADAGTLAARVALVVGNNSRSGIFSVARDHGVPALHLSTVTHPDDDDRDQAMLAALLADQVDLVVLAGYLKKIGPRVRDAFESRIVNTHPSLLPAYGSGGMYGDRVHEAVLADGVKITGATVHSVTEHYDEGPILAQSTVPVETDDDLISLRDRVRSAEKALLLQWLRTWAER